MLVVGDEFRTNPLAAKPGGSTIRIIDKQGNDRIYDKIKFPAAYISKLDLSEIQTLILDGREIKIVNKA